MTDLSIMQRTSAPHDRGTRTFGLVDVTLRDAHQCLWSTRMTTSTMTPILGAIDRVGDAYVNTLGGAVFDVCVRCLQENPWRRVGLLCDRLETPCDGLTRGQSLYTFELFPDDIVALNSRVLAGLGLSALTVYDALNDNRNIVSSVRSAHEAGMKVNANADLHAEPPSTPTRITWSEQRNWSHGTSQARARAHAVSGARRGGRGDSARSATAWPNTCSRHGSRRTGTPHQQKRGGPAHGQAKGAPRPQRRDVSAGELAHRVPITSSNSWRVIDCPSLVGHRRCPS
ncbi:hypothetical protein [Caballeronia sp. NK8]|uniref:hypothetical protein n=1 Tax=Caballeronia sp. NK8 TaxID=140098 RepID=UPI001BCF23E9|nr:hypothetical protein [Caballeronia sp. NK8]